MGAMPLSRPATPACPVCAGPGVIWGRTPSSSGFHSIELRRCRACGQVWKVNLPARPQELAVQALARDFALADGRLVLKQLPREIVGASGVRVLDVGCWDGALLQELPAAWLRHGIEPHPQAARQARTRGVTVFEQTLETAPLAPGSYDLVLVMDVLEHLEEPAAALRKLAQALAPGGYLVGLTGNAATPAARVWRGCWYYCNYAEHVGFFSPASLQRALEQAGLRVLNLRKCAHHAARLSVTWGRIVRRLRRTAAAHEGALPLPHARWDLLRLVLSRLFRGRDHLLVVARKPARP